MGLPNDAVMLLSVVNTMLRDKYSSMEELCDRENANIEELEKKLNSIDYYYDPDKNQWI